MAKPNNTFWSQTSLGKKIGLWSDNQIKNIFLPMLELQANELVYDIGSGFSPLGNALLPFLLPNGLIKGFDRDQKTVDLANEFVNNKGLNNHISFFQGDVYTIDEEPKPLADLVMCQQLLVNLPDPVTALEHMLNLIKSTGRIFCLENINYGAYVSRPDFSNKTNFELSQIWQELCIIGKQGYDFGDSTFGANLPQVFYELGLYDISWQFISSGVNQLPPYSKEFKTAFLQNHIEEKNRLKELINSWALKTNLTESKVNFFIEQVITSDYDEYAIKNDLFLTQWYYPLIAIIGWLEPKNKMTYSEDVKINLE